MNYYTAPTIDARAVWLSDAKESAKLYRQFLGYFKGSLKAIQSYYGWKRMPMLKALRYGRQYNEKI